LETLKVAVPKNESSSQPYRKPVKSFESGDGNEGVSITKKRRTTESGDAVATVVDANILDEDESTDPTKRKLNQNGKSTRKVNPPFKRIDLSKVTSHVVKDNRYVAKVRFWDVPAFFLF
jgi:hypothetical protein